MTAVWPKTTVGDESLTRCVSDVRRALGDGRQHIIKTVPKRGYLVDVPVLPGTVGSGATGTASGKSALQPSATAHGGSDKAFEDARKVVPAGERKQVTVLCANFRTSLVAAAEHDPEEALAVFEAALDLVTDAVERYEGTVNVVTAHGAVALFGVPHTQEDHAIRACHAAVQIQDAVRRYARTAGHAVGKALLVEIGLNSGELVTRASLGRSPGEYRAMGQTTELAARLEQMAPPGTTLLSRETLRLTEGHIRAKAFAAAQPQSDLVYELVDVGPAQSRFQALAARGLTGFAGRDAEMAQLERIEAKVRQGRGQVVAVIGEPGVGKSRLLHEFFRTQRQGEVRILDTASVSYRKATSYLPIIRLLQSYLGIDDRDGVAVMRDKVGTALLALDPALAADLAPLLRLLDIPIEDEQAFWDALDPAQRRQRTLEALKRLILREALRQPVILAFEDLHWIDGESQAFLETLVDGLTQARLLLLLTYRPEYRHGWGGKSCYTQLRLNAFEGRTSEEFLANLVGGDATLERLKALLPAYGNPFFLEESVRSLVEIKVIEGTPGNYRLVGHLPELRIPATVQAILAARIDRLSPTAKELLQAASVIGTQVPHALLRPLVGLTEDDLGVSLAELRDGEFLFESRLFPDVEYAFKHALTHDVAYGSLLSERRQTLHRRCLEIIQRLGDDRLPERAEQLAHHAVRGEVWDEAVIHLRQAGRKAAARSAPDDARACLEQALGILSALPPSALNLQQALEARLELRPVLNQLGEPRRMLERLHEAESLAERLNDDRQRGRVCAFMATTHSLLGELDAAIATSMRAREIAAVLGDLELRILGTSFLAQAHYYRGEYEAVVRVATDNLAVLPADWTYEYFGNVAPASVFDRAWLAMALAQLGRFCEAARQEAEAIRLAEPMQHAFTLGRAYLATGTLYPLQGAWTTAQPPIERWIEVARTGNVALHLPWAVASSAWVLAELGKTSEALARVKDGEILVDRQAARGIVGQSAWAYHALGRAALLLGRGDDAQRLAERAMQTSIAQHGFRAHVHHLMATSPSLLTGATSMPARSTIAGLWPWRSHAECARSLPAAI
jgi:predicted ATPase/class 3 adenylate cyclase